MGQSEVRSEVSLFKLPQAIVNLQMNIENLVVQRQRQFFRLWSENDFENIFTFEHSNFFEEFDPGSG